MVLMRTLLLSLTALLAAACVTTPAPMRLSSETPIAVAVVVDQPGKLEPGAPPQAILDALKAALEKRNLTPVFSTSTTGRMTADRLDSLGDGNALLVEVQAAYYSNLNGLFRWVVNGQITLRGAGEGRTPESSAFERPVFLRFQHQGAGDAIVSAEESLVRSTMYVVDGWIEGHPEGKAPKRAAVSPREALARDSAIYFAMVDRYKNGDVGNDGDVDPSDPAAFHGGDLDGIREDLERLRDLGMSSIWLSPIYATRPDAFEGHGAFHGYWVRDFSKTEPRFGGEAALDRLVKALEAQGMGLMLDVVLNHADYDAPISEQRPELFHPDGPITDWDDPVQLVRGQVHGLPDFAHEKKETRDFLVGVHRDWVRRTKPTRIRIDAARHMDPAFLKDFGAAMREASDGPLQIVGEYWDGNPAALAEKAEAAGFDAVFDFPLYYALTEGLCQGGHLGALASQAGLARVYPNGARGLVTFVDNHDLPRAATKCPGRVEQALAAVILSRGTPAIAWGTEAGLEGGKEPANRGDMPTGALKYADTVTELLALRRAHPELTWAKTRVDVVDERFLAFSRALEGGVLEVALNAGDAPRAWDAEGELVFARGGCDGAVAPGAVCARMTTRALDLPASATARVTVKGDDLVLVGAAPELGGWNPAKAPKAEGGLISVELPPAVYQCKLARVSGDQVDWEPTGNRYLVVGKGGARAEWTWGS
jgi:alpha-amylase